MEPSQALSLIAHEIRTPLGVIKGFLDLMNDPTMSSEEFQQFKKIVDRNCVHLLRLSDDIIEITKAGDGKISTKKTHFSLPELLQDLRSVAAVKIGDKNLVFQLRAKTLIPEMVYSDRTRLLQIFTNLIDNAVKFTEQGSVQLLLGYQDNCLKFKISDTGCGISPDYLSNLFIPFCQGQYRAGGAGIGLALAKRLAELLDGDLQLESTKANEGTTFEGFISTLGPNEVKLIKLQDERSPFSAPQ
jgi:signal transduction histidine kinase